MRPLTDKQKSRLWEQTRNSNFQASRRLEGVSVPLVTLTAEEAQAREEAERAARERPATPPPAEGDVDEAVDPDEGAAEGEVRADEE